MIPFDVQVLREGPVHQERPNVTTPNHHICTMPKAQCLHHAQARAIFTFDAVEHLVAKLELPLYGFMGSYLHFLLLLHFCRLIPLSLLTLTHILAAFHTVVPSAPGSSFPLDILLKAVF